VKNIIIKQERKEKSKQKKREKYYYKTRKKRKLQPKTKVDKIQTQQKSE
jgi:hypothetical protein